MDITCNFIYNILYIKSALYNNIHYFQSKSSHIRQVVWNIAILKDMALIFLSASWHDKALEIISFITSNEGSVMGILNNKQINELLEICILQGYGYIALVRYIYIYILFIYHLTLYMYIYVYIFELYIIR